MEKSCSALNLRSGRLPCGAATQLPAPDGATWSKGFVNQLGRKVPHKWSYWEWILPEVLSKSRVLCHKAQQAPNLEPPCSCPFLSWQLHPITDQMVPNPTTDQHLVMRR